MKKKKLKNELEINVKRIIYMITYEILTMSMYTWNNNHVLVSKIVI